MFTLNFKHELFQVLTKKQELALGSRLLWRELRKEQYNKNTLKIISQACIQLQTYYKGENNDS